MQALNKDIKVSELKKDKYKPKMEVYYLLAYQTFKTQTLLPIFLLNG